jgi:ProP effector
MMEELTLKNPLSSQDPENLSELAPDTKGSLSPGEGADLRESPSETPNPSPSCEKPPPIQRGLAPKDKVNQKKSRENFEAAKAWLEKEFPQVFNPREPTPLKTGIRKELLAKGVPFSATQLNKVLGAYVHSLGYLKAIVEGQWRYGLNGGPVEKISQEHREHAKKQLDSRKARWLKNKGKTRRQKFEWEEEGARNPETP